MNRLLPVGLLAFLSCAGVSLAQPPAAPVDYLLDLDSYGYLEPVIDSPRRSDGGHIVPLGAIQKIRGVWAPRAQERVRGPRQAFTWRVIDGFTSAEVLSELEQRLRDDPRVSTLFTCDARSCGASVQWANRIFRQRLLYGREGDQSYRALTIVDGGKEYRLLLYASARSTDRQYFHADLIERQAPSQ